MGVSFHSRGSHRKKEAKKLERAKRLSLFVVAVIGLASSIGSCLRLGHSLSRQTVILTFYFVNPLRSTSTHLGHTSIDNT